MENNNVYREIDYLLQKMRQESLTKEEYQLLQKLLICHRNHYINHYPVCETTLTGNKIMFISDTHIREDDENFELIDASYNKAEQEKIKTVVHLGDLINGPVYVSGMTFQKLKKQISLSLEHMKDGITTKLLLGNHDYHAIDRFPGIEQLYFGNPKLEILGMKYVVVRWNDFVRIGLYHDISKLVTEEPSHFDLLLCGHFHTFEVDESSRSILVPNLQQPPIVKTLKEYGIDLHVIQDAYIIASIEDASTVLFRLYDSNDSTKAEVTYHVKSHTLKKY